MKRMTEMCLCSVLALGAMTFIAEVGVLAQQPGGGPGSVVFYSARDGHPNNQIYVMDSDGNNQRRVTYDVASDVDPDISPNGKRIAFTSNQPGNNDIFVRDRFGGLTNLTNNPANDEWARWSPSGRQIVFDSNRDGGVYEIYIMNADGGGAPKRLTDPPTLSRYPSWSPDGKQLVFRRGIDIYVMDSDGSEPPTQLTNEVAPSFAQMPVFSPDGRYIAFMSFRQGYCSVFRMKADGTEQINLTPKNPGDASTSWCSRAPAWSTDGQEIFFMSFRPSTAGHNEIFVMNVDGTDVRQLTDVGVSGSPRAR